MQTSTAAVREQAHNAEGMDRGHMTAAWSPVSTQCQNFDPCPPYPPNRDTHCSLSSTSCFSSSCKPWGSYIRTSEISVLTALYFRDGQRLMPHFRRNDFRAVAPMSSDFEASAIVRWYRCMHHTYTKRHERQLVLVTGSPARAVTTMRRALVGRNVQSTAER